MKTRNFIALAVMALVGLASSFIILVNKIALLENPSTSVSCNINPLLSCSNVMESAQAETFGFPNPILGVIGFSMLLVFSILGLIKTEFKPVVYKLGLLAAIFGESFSFYLFYQTTYVIGAICLYCVAVWFASLITFSEFLAYNLPERVKTWFPFKPSWILGLLVWFTLLGLIYMRYEYQFRLYFFT